ncbi:DUF3515 domain-containing protein [Actinotalea sp. M2MS4P-6]|uniref:DUF3515 domain-containing protein n=1 Tax=Actinotalea sp. M2MS4P-6 TaxID=2983762 RepID=UPI0021E3BD02|nr:DUF3515 domain-containing protein [Actinotalea sp. M2MS4P-6]MCV2393990.1 DUF3515 domain-containing protein [Actinotalea sp. M2MS4P-6]
MRPLPVAAALALVVPLAGCATRVPVEPAPSAGDPLCAEVVLALPLELGGLERVLTDSQASMAWGDPAHPIVLRCGVEPPGPTTDQCVTADDGEVAVDWVAVPGEADATGAADWTFTTYGRSPAVEVFVPAEVTGTRSTSFLVELGPAISKIPATRHCV